MQGTLHETLSLMFRLFRSLISIEGLIRTQNPDAYFQDCYHVFLRLQRSRLKKLQFVVSKELSQIASSDSSIRFIKLC